jgi:hypothetical protein
MKTMTRLLLLLSCSGALLLAADLPGVHSVYVMPMSQGMDQFLANRLAAEHAFHVVSDLKLADAVLTDRIGPSLNASLDEAAPKPPAPPEDKDKDKDKDAKKAPTAQNTLDNPSLSSTFGRGKGTFFLVDAKSRQVLWSTFETPKNSTANELDRTASDIVSRLMHDLRKK